MELYPKVAVNHHQNDASFEDVKAFIKNIATCIDRKNEYRLLTNQMEAIQVKIIQQVSGE